MEGSHFCNHCGMAQGKTSVAATQGQNNHPDWLGDVDDTAFSVGTKVWIGFCIAGRALSIPINLAASIFPMAALSVVGLAMYIWLLVQRRKLSFYGIVGEAVLVVALNILVYNMGFFGALGLLNPLITYQLIKDQLPYMR